jgi:hypothetical protein
MAKALTTPSRFNVADPDLHQVLGWTCWLFSAWMAVVGVLIIATPARRFGNSWHFLIVLPGGQYLQGALFLGLGLLMLVSLWRRWQNVMAHCALLGGIGSVVVGTFLLAGALAAPTGVMGAPFAYLIGALFIMLSVLLGKRRSVSGTRNPVTM